MKIDDLGFAPADLGGSVVKNLPANAGDPAHAGSILGLGRSPGGGNGYPPQYSCLDSPMDRGGRRAAVHGVAESQTRWRERVHTSADPAVFSLSVAQNVRFLFQWLPFISRQNSESVKVISDTA